VAYDIEDISRGKKRQYRIVSKINRGNFAHSFKAQAGQRSYFLKQYVDPSTLFTPWFRTYEAYQGEIIRRLMANPLKDFVVSVEEVYIYDDFYIQVHAWHDGCSLNNRMENLDLDKESDRKRALALARAFVYAMDLIHQSGIIHSDLKPENVFLDNHDEVLISDFDWSLITGQPHPWQGRPRSTPGYASFEHLSDSPVGVKSDIFTCGIILCQLLAGYHPMKRLLQPGRTYREDELKMYLRAKILRQGVEDLLSVSPKAVLTKKQSEMIKRCLSHDERLRPTAAEIHQALTIMSSPVDVWLNHVNGFSLITHRHEYENKTAFIGRSRCRLFPNSEYVSNLQAWLSPSSDYCFWYIVAPQKMPTHGVRVTARSAGKLGFFNKGGHYEVSPTQVMMPYDQILLETGQKIEIFNMQSGQVYVEWTVELKPAE
jgi:serine/threonine protein kinase